MHDKFFLLNRLKQKLMINLFLSVSLRRSAFGNKKCVYFRKIYIKKKQEIQRVRTGSQKKQSEQ